MEQLPELTDQNIKEFLEDSPLYEWKEFKIPNIYRIGLWINEIDAFCTTCNQIRPFHDSPRDSVIIERKQAKTNRKLALKPSPISPIGSSLNHSSIYKSNGLFTGQTYFEFSCVSCKKDRYEYCVDHVVTGNTIKIQKYGELPRQKLERDKLLQKFFANDSDCYEKALVCLSHGYGIAAFAYLRRIIENNILKLLDMLQEDINSSGGNVYIENALTELRKDSPMSKNIEVANNALPDYLNPHGLNPLGKLYKVLSEGVHSLSDEECLKKANEVKVCLKFLISELADRKKNREQFKKMVGSLSK